MTGHDLHGVFRAHGGRFDGDDAALEEELRGRMDAARAAWPAFALDDATFVAHLATHAREALPPRAHAADLWIACACASGAVGAVNAFERAYRPTVERAVARVNRSSLDEGTQAALVLLLVAEPGKKPRIAEYAGRAPLRSWIVTVATRATLGLHRKRDDAPYDSLSGLADDVAVAEPELAMAKARHAPDLEAALRAALAGLDKRQRVLLRLKHVKGWRLEQVATMYRVSRATAARMVTAAHDALLSETKRILRENLKITASEVESLLALLQSDVQVSLVRLLDDA